MGPQAPKPAVMPEHALWTLTKRDHRVEARARDTPGGLELRIVIDGELWWSRVCPTIAVIQAEAETKHAEFLAKGWRFSKARFAECHRVEFIPEDGDTKPPRTM